MGEDRCLVLTAYVRGAKFPIAGQAGGTRQAHFLFIWIFTDILQPHKIAVKKSRKGKSKTVPCEEIDEPEKGIHVCYSVQMLFMEER